MMTISTAPSSLKASMMPRWYGARANRYFPCSALSSGDKYMRASAHWLIVIVGGGAVNDVVYAKSRADLWCPDLLKLPEVCHDWLRSRKPEAPTRQYTLD
jgi:hypothetical protein